jgi:CelD/BcsL family acetyltransferase involved in cellulose biosynthesis
LQLVRHDQDYRIYAAPAELDAPTRRSPSPEYRVRTCAPADLDRTSLATWADLEGRALEPNAYVSPHFVLPALRFLDPRAKAVVALVERAASGGTTVVGAAVFVPVVGTRQLPVPHLVAYRSRHSFLSGILLDRDQAEPALGALCAWLRAQRWRWHGLEIRRAWADGAQADLVGAAVDAGGMVRHQWDPRQRAVLVPVRDLPALEASYAPRLRQDLRRRRRRLEELGTVRAVLHRDRGIPDASLESFLALEHQGWKGEAKTSLRARPADEAFFRETVARFAQSRRVFFTELTLDGAPIASTANFVSGHAGFAFKLGWRSDLAKLAPGIMNAVELSRRFAEGACDDLSFFDSGTSEGSFVEDLWKERRPLVSTTITTTPLGGAALALTQQARSIRRRFRPDRAPRPADGPRSA